MKITTNHFCAPLLLPILPMVKVNIDSYNERMGGLFFNFCHHFKTQMHYGLFLEF